MRLLLCPHRDRQHLYPLVPLAWACRAAGHEVRVAAAPGLADAIISAGLPAVSVGRDAPAPGSGEDAAIAQVYQHRPFPADWPAHPHLLDDEQRATIELLGRKTAATAEHTVDDLVGFARAWRPDVVVHDTAGLAGAVAAAAIGVPNVRYLTGVGLRPMETRVGSAEPLPEYAALFDRRGWPVRAQPTMTIDPSPPSLRLPVPEPWREARYVPYNGPGVLPAWLAKPGERPRVCLTWGLSVSRVSRRLGAAALRPPRLALEALAGLAVEVILTATDDQLALLGDLPGNVRPVRSVPLYLLLPHCALIVHQAGDGTALTAAACGTPQLAITRKPDPALTGSRLAAAGVGEHLRSQEIEHDPAAVEMIRARAAAVLTDAAYRHAALRLRAEIERQPAPAELVSAVTELAGATT